MGTVVLRFIAALALAGLCGSCADQARVYSLDEASVQTGVPKIEFVRRGLGSGSVTITMPDGEVLKGEYYVTENAAVAWASEGRFATAIGYGSGRPVVVNAVGSRGTIMNCEGAIDIGGHGSLICQPGGQRYRMMI
jgi:hypothetical protein